ncbi:LuxR C-terminal-related transcriptional regulator [Amaricoccus sp.]|uniref:LuxR C-terminal-related transcriptional regulator n=1 Tax=Amaricoccus sp. TaxID=1872485 RepID=UPI002626A175|nr:LuxR C-terminal-related transcriptional regulator [Amaricoccus sp.]HRO09913.1 LuxR C-terminal-related transcriptional regulator [Amaricoccus sp.]
METTQLAEVGSPSGETAPAELLLRATPPRIQRDLLSRPRLALGSGRFRDAHAIVIQAPPGYGKTSLLAQWRREALGNGAIVLWLTASPGDDPGRLLRSLVVAFRGAACRPTFGQALLASPPADPLEGITEWLAEITQSALDIVLVLDEANRLSPATFEALAYLLRNLPPNVRVLIGMQGATPAGLDDLVAYGDCATVGASDLRFEVDEAIALVRQRFGADFDPGIAVRLHEMADGWPLGLQMVVAVMAADRDPRAAAQSLLRQKGELHQRFSSLLLANLDPADRAFLERVSIVDGFSPALAATVAGAPDAAERLRRIACTTPVLVAGEQSDWVRLHALARDALKKRFGELAPEEQAAVHARAAEWLSANGLPAIAARHALAAGRQDWACELAERSLYDSVMAHGRLDDVQEWFSIIPSTESDCRPRLLLAAAWSLAISERHEAAERLVARVLARDDIDDEIRCECALVRAGAAVFADDPDRFAALHDPWAVDPPLTDPWLLRIHANRSAFRALIDGEPALARLRQQRAPRGDPDAPPPAYLAGWSDLIVGLTYLWEGQILLAERILRPALLQADADLGRRSSFSCMLAALLAAALWVRGAPREAELTLANRLDVLERSALPDAVILAFRTLALIAEETSEARALEVLEGLYAVGELRGLPRLRISSLSEQVMLHARHYRVESCRALVARIDALVAAEAPLRGPRWLESVEIYRDVAHGCAAIAARDWKGARAPFERANAAARAAKRQRLNVETLGFRALVLHNAGEDASELAQEAVELANVYGLARVFEAAHPALGDRIGRIAARAADAAGIAPEPRNAPPAAAASTRDDLDLVAHSSALTPKEREVLVLLARSLSNKEIGLTMNIHEDTVKWHVKNLFAKLSAGTRKQVVSRARLMGILAPAG